MVEYKIIFSKQATKDRALLRQVGLEKKAKEILNKMQEDPFVTPPKVEGLKGNLQGCYSRRLSIQHRIVYQVFENEHIIRILRMWTYYER